MNIIATLSLYHLLSSLKASPLTLLHSERPKLHTILAFLSAIGLSLTAPTIKFAEFA